MFCAASATAEAPSIAAKGPDYWNLTYYPTGGDASSFKKAWYIVDAEGQTLGRLATLVASTIRYRGNTCHTHHNLFLRNVIQATCFQFAAASSCGCRFRAIFWLQLIEAR